MQGAIRDLDSPRVLQVWSHGGLLSAGRLFSDFERGLYEPDRIEGCLNSHPRRGEFFNTLQAEFYEGSIAHLRNARLPGLNAFMNQIDRQYSLNFRKSEFRLTGHFNHGSPDERFAGVHRATGSIYMDLSRIPRDEWFVIFLHEMVHKVDKKLQQAVQDYALPWGLQEGLWKPVSRLERILAEKPSPQTLEAFLYDYLEARATRPSGGIYASPVVQEALDQILLEARTAEGALEVGPAAEY